MSFEANCFILGLDQKRAQPAQEKVKRIKEKVWAHPVKKEQRKLKST
jgi:hypothetical protein